ncbi:hypothetical protein JTE90_014934 [Oedothorax gibbosus]|uniref:Uncharacterized protein n=1 Tax=Oedothorax gibbosus TaxID=931172 RepID=A0AAV6VN42_9ARAC|nr:hypothetical protein JTE90_014934 [Oedothorax gibbosus]
MRTCRPTSTKKIPITLRIRVLQNEARILMSRGSMKYLLCDTGRVKEGMTQVEPDLSGGGDVNKQLRYRKMEYEMSHLVWGSDLQLKLVKCFVDAEFCLL